MLFAKKVLCNFKFCSLLLCAGLPRFQDLLPLNLSATSDRLLTIWHMAACQALQRSIIEPWVTLWSTVQQLPRSIRFAGERGCKHAS
jgi:hypothetical protein